MAGKGVALFVVCLVFFAAVHVPRAVADDAVFSECFKKCDDTCKGQGMGQTFCEMKCDTDCFNKEFDGNII